MRSRELHAALADYFEQAGARLRAELSAGEEVGFEVGPRRGGGRGATPLYCYRALTGEFIDQREAMLERLPAHGRALEALAQFGGLGRYLAARQPARGPSSPRAAARAALKLLLADVFEEQASFELRHERVEAALERLDCAALAGEARVTLLGTLHGVTLASPELRLGEDLLVAHPDALEGLPEEALVGEGPSHLLAVHTAAEGDPADTLARGRSALSDLLRALRLFGDGRISLGAIGWTRAGAGPWRAVAIPAGGRPRGMLLVAQEQEEELRAFCEVLARRPPAAGLAWALRRFELGCERPDPLEGLTDHLLALRALLEPEGPQSDMLAVRLGALCATASAREELAGRARDALALETSLRTGGRIRKKGALALCEELAGHLRALLSDVVCGHLDAELWALADEPLAREAEQAPPPAEADSPADPEALVAAAG